MFDNGKGSAGQVRARTRWIRHENFEELTYLRKPSIRFGGTRRRGQEKSRALIALLARALNRRYIDGLGSATQGWRLGPLESCRLESFDRFAGPNHLSHSPSGNLLRSAPGRKRLL